MTTPDTLPLWIIAGAMVVDAVVAVCAFAFHVAERQHRKPHGPHGPVR